MDSIRERREAHLHYAAAFIGGFLGIFPIVNAVHLLGSAQTSNMIDIVLAIVGGDFRSLVFHLIGFCLYVVPIFLVTVISKRTRLNVKILAMIIDSACVVAMWRFPIEKNLPLIFYLYPTFFAMSFQWCSFKGAYGFVSATIFSTNNLRQFVSAATEVFCNGEKSFSLKAKFFGATLLAFHLGVAASGVCWRFFGNAGFLFTLAPICLAVILILRGNVVE